MQTNIKVQGSLPQKFCVTDQTRISDGKRPSNMIMTQRQHETLKGATEVTSASDYQEMARLSEESVM